MAQATHLGALADDAPPLGARVCGQYRAPEGHTGSQRLAMMLPQLGYRPETQFTHEVVPW